MARTQQRAFTLLELLIVTGMIGLLVALLLPAVQLAREAGRRLNCQTNLKQIGSALQHYQSALGCFPPAVIWAPRGEPLGQGLLPIGVIDRVARYGEIEHDTLYANWLVSLLPYLEQGAVVRSGNLNMPISHPANALLRTAEIPLLKCPSDSFSEGNHYLRGLDAGLATNEYARGNYAINVGPDANCVAGMRTATGDPCSDGFQVDSTDLKATNARLWGSGIAGVNVSLADRDVPDGASSTVAVDEIRAGLNAADPRGAWALGQIGASLVARHGRYSDVGGPNPTGADAIIGCWTLKYDLAPDTPESQGMPCRKEIGDEELNLKAASRSLHPGGVNVLMCDGSAHFASNEISRDVWHALHTRDRGEVVEWAP
ncbi:MAG: DUF1559 domain-containing protein [Pirellulales bacterium]|nr:DUF1559 domain-containing protein [Pirellulales bacterium]